MKTAILSVVAACMLFSLTGCNNCTEVEVLQPTWAAGLRPMQQSWRDILPCADCGGIETSLSLEKDDTWVMSERYQGVWDEPSSFASYGTRARTAGKLVLIDSKGEKPYYQVKGEALEMLDREGNLIESQSSYTPQSVSASLPVTPMPMRGMYFYTADAVALTDCAMGKWMPAANNVQLERDYLAARAESGQFALLMLGAHFTLELNPDTGEKVKTLMANKDAKFIPGKVRN